MHALRDGDFCGIIRRGRQKKLKLDCDLTWRNLCAHRETWLNLVSWKQFGTGRFRSTCLVTYAQGRRFEQGQRALTDTALSVGGLDYAVSWNRNKLMRTHFYEENRAILDQRRGAGYWAWKPYIILDQLRRIREGDIVVYYDSGRNGRYQFRSSLDPLLNWCLDHSHGVLPGVWTPHVNRRWTKRDCFVYMGCDGEKYWNDRQVQATFSVWQRNELALRFVEAWCDFCTDARIVTDAPNTCGLPNLRGFKDHRHDQSVLTNLVIRDGLTCYGIPSHKMKGSRKDINQLVATLVQDGGGDVSSHFFIGQ